MTVKENEQAQLITLFCKLFFISAWGKRETIIFIWRKQQRAALEEDGLEIWQPRGNLSGSFSMSVSTSSPHFTQEMIHLHPGEQQSAISKLPMSYLLNNF